MNSKHMSKLLAALLACAAVAAGAFSATAFAEDYYDNGEQYDNGDQQEASVEYIPQEVAPDTVYIPPETSTSDNDDDDYFGQYHEGTEYDYNAYDNTDDLTGETAQETGETTEPDGEASEESSEIDPEEISVDTKELTSKDWEEIQNSLTSQQQSGSEKSEASGKQTGTVSKTSGGESFGTLKDKSTKDDVNDTWIYLVIGIPLLLAGIAMITVVIIVNVRAKKKEEAEKAKNELPETDPLADGGKGAKKVINKPKRSAFGAKHVAPVKTQSRDVVQKDLVDTLDAPENDDDN